MARRPLVALALVVAVARARVAILSGHGQASWADDACLASADSLTACNLRVYEAAVAAGANASVVLFPEA